MLTPCEAIEVVRKLSGFMYFDIDGSIPTGLTTFGITLHDPDLYSTASILEYQYDKSTNDLTQGSRGRLYNLFYVINDKIFSSFNLNSEDITINNKEDLEKFLLDVKYKLKLAKEKLRQSRLTKDFE